MKIITRYFERVDALNDEELDVDKTIALKEQLVSKFVDLKKVQTEVEENVDEDGLEEIITTFSEFELNYNEKVTKLNRQLSRATNEGVSSRSNGSAEPRQVSSVKLPKLIIKPFDGNLQQWKTFYDCFVTSVHETHLSNIEKFNYLKGYMVGDAAKIIEGLTLSNENYEKALDMLKETYGDKDKIVSMHMKELVEMEPVVSDEDVAALRKFYTFFFL